MDKIISSPDAATGKTTATVKDFSLDFRKFQMWMEHRTLEKFYDYIDNVKTITHRFQKKHHEVFEIKEDNYIEEWTEFIKETYGDMVVEEATDFYKKMTVNIIQTRIDCKRCVWSMLLEIIL